MKVETESLSKVIGSLEKNCQSIIDHQEKLTDKVNESIVKTKKTIQLKNNKNEKRCINLIIA